jgi:hypothetical protein
MIRVTLTLALILVATPAPAPEFGNLLGSSSVERASAKASARALEGLERVLNALRLRELEGLKAGGPALDNAADSLLDAAKDMRLILPQLTQNDRQLRIDNLQPPERLFVTRVFTGLGQPVPTKQSDLYILFVSETEKLGTLVETSGKAAGSGTPIMPIFVEDMARYLRLGSAVTVLARTAAQ